jgi:thiamine kinase-like enzyme
MSNLDLKYKNKYLKYKNKYLNLKKMIGGGIDAYCEIKDREITLTYKDPYNLDIINIIYYTIERELGEGSNGVVYLIKNSDTKDSKSYIYKQGICIINKDEDEHNVCEIYNEGKKSEKLKGILDDRELEKDMLVLFQGFVLFQGKEKKEKTDFLISTYNGKDLYQEFKNEKQKIKEQYVNVTTQLLDLLHQINSNKIFHNDIKLANITIKDGKVYLIDFGLLTKYSSDMGTLISMSFNGVIACLKAKFYTIRYSTIFPILELFLIDTDMVGFFYCCIDLLGLSLYDKYLSINIFSYFSIKDFVRKDLYKLFELFYFILPTSIKKNISVKVSELSNDNKKVTQPSLNTLIKESEKYNSILPTIEDAKSIFGKFPDYNTKLFRFMAFIYNKIKEVGLIKSEDQRWYIEFLRIMSDCFLPNFDYDKFKGNFNFIVSQFSESQSLPASSTVSLPASSTVSLPASSTVSLPTSSTVSLPASSTVSLPTRQSQHLPSQRLPQQLLPQSVDNTHIPFELLINKFFELDKQLQLQQKKPPPTSLQKPPLTPIQTQTPPPPQSLSSTQSSPPPPPHSPQSPPPPPPPPYSPLLTPPPPPPPPYSPPQKPTPTPTPKPTLTPKSQQSSSPQSPPPPPPYSPQSPPHSPPLTPQSLSTQSQSPPPPPHSLPLTPQSLSSTPPPPPLTPQSLSSSTQSSPPPPPPPHSLPLTPTPLTPTPLTPPPLTPTPLTPQSPPPPPPPPPPL